VEDDGGAVTRASEPPALVVEEASAPAPARPARSFKRLTPDRVILGGGRAAPPVVTQQGERQQAVVVEDPLELDVADDAPPRADAFEGLPMSAEEDEEVSPELPV
jgi:hypothetical protein